MTQFRDDMAAEDNSAARLGKARAHVSDAQPSIVIAGAGETGLSVARHLNRLDTRFDVVDSRETPPNRHAFAELEKNRKLDVLPLCDKTLVAASEIVLSPGIPREERAVAGAIARGCSVVGDIELFARCVEGDVYGITGSNGKSTVTTMLRDILRGDGQRVVAGGNLGPPALDLLTLDVSTYVLELSSFQLESTESLRVAAGAVLNISEDHQDRYESMSSYLAAKMRLADMSQHLVVPIELVPMVPARAPETLHTFSHRLDVDADFGLVSHTGQDWLYLPSGLLMPRHELGAPGLHNVANALAACALAWTQGVNPQAMREALRKFSGLEHRCQRVIEVDGVRWINDSKATNVGATQAAIAGLAPDGPILWLAGGVGKDADFSPLAQAVVSGVRHAILFGEDAELIEGVVKDQVQTTRVSDLRAAVVKASELAQTGDSVLLSPACASFDMFKNYADRGRQFAQLVNEVVEL